MQEPGWFLRGYERDAYHKINANKQVMAGLLEMEQIGTTYIVDKLVEPFKTMKRLSEDKSARQTPGDFFYDWLQRNILDEAERYRLLDRWRNHPTDPGGLFNFPPTKKRMNITDRYDADHDDEGDCIMLPERLTRRHFKVSRMGYCQVQLTEHHGRRPPKGMPGRSQTKGKQDRQSYLHRIICYLVAGPPTARYKYAIHSCGNKRCISPHHVHWGTQAENLAKGPRVKVKVQGVGPIQLQLDVEQTYVFPDNVMQRRRQLLRRV